MARDINTKIFVGSLPASTKPQELRRLFESYGVVTECDVMNRCGFIHMETAEMAENAIKALNATLFKGQTIVVEPGRQKNSSKKNKTTHDRGRNSSSSRRQNRRGNVESMNRWNQSMPPNNNNTSSNLNSEEALQLASALFYEVSKMLNPTQDDCYQNAGPANNSQISEVGRISRRNERGGKGQNRGNNRSRSQQNNKIGPMRGNMNKSMRNVAPYNKDMPRNNNSNQSNRGQGSGFGMHGNFNNQFQNQPTFNDMLEMGNSDRGSFGNGFNGNNMSNFNGLERMNFNSGNFAGNNTSGDNFRRNNFNDNFGMGNQDRRGFALPENKNFGMNGQQILNALFNGQNNNNSEGFFNKRAENFGAQSMNNNNPFNNRQQKNFGFENQNSGLNRGNSFGNIGNNNLKNNFNTNGMGKFNNFDSGCDGNFSDDRNMGSNFINFQNDFPPLDAVIRNQPRKNTMANRRFN